MYYGQRSSRNIDERFIAHTSIGQIVKRDPRLNLMIANYYWRKMFKVLVGAQRRGYLGSPVVLLALLNYYTAGITRTANDYQELTQLMGATPSVVLSNLSASEEIEILRKRGVLQEYQKKLQQDFSKGLGE